MFDAQKRINELQKKLKKWAKEYYELDNPTVEDAVYDQNYKELQEFEKKYPDLVTKNSITQKVGGKTSNKFLKEKHQFPMLSLSNANSFADIQEFDRQIKKELYTKKDIEYVVEYKIDGLSISLIYEKGLLKKAVTRGDGYIGENVITNVLQINSIPPKIPYQNKIEFRGEIYMENSTFSLLNEQGNQFANPRNAASGTLRQLDQTVVKSRNLQAFIYSIPNPLDYNLKTHNETLSFIKKQNLPINEDSQKVSSINQVIKQIENLTEKRYKLPYEIDGLVVKVNDISTYNDIGFTSKFPKFMIAYKFPHQIVSTKLLQIFPTVGRTGKITYNAKLESVKLSGSTVSAATLHNSDYIKKLNLNENDLVNITKANEIIPKVLSVKEKVNNSQWEEQTFCPSCKSALQRIEPEVDQYCINLECPEIRIASLEHFVARKGMNIEHFSSETIRKLIDEKLLTDIVSIYQLKNKREEIIQLERFATKSVDNILNAIEKSKNADLDKFIFSLGIRYIGEKNSKILAKRYGSLKKITSLTYEDLINVANLGQKAVLSIIHFFQNEENLKLVDDLIALGFEFKEIKKRTSTILQGLKFVITGTLSQSRDYFKDIIENNDGNLVNSLSSRTSYLLVGENPGNKYKKAKKLKVNTINEKEFWTLLEQKEKENEG